MIYIICLNVSVVVLIMYVFVKMCTCTSVTVTSYHILITMHFDILMTTLIVLIHVFSTFSCH